MTDENTNAIARAIMPPHPARSQGDKIYRETGRSVIALSNIELDLRFLFGVLVAPSPYEVATLSLTKSPTLARSLSW